MINMFECLSIVIFRVLQSEIALIVLQMHLFTIIIFEFLILLHYTNCQTCVLPNLSEC